MALFRSVLSVITEERLLIIHLALVLTACIAVGIGGLETSNQASPSAGAFDQLEEVEGTRYVASHYPTAESTARPTFVYVRDQDGNVLSRRALLDALQYQQQVSQNENVRRALPDEGGRGGVPNLIAKRLAGDRDADLATQIAALEAADNEQVAAVVESTFTEGSRALVLLPESYEPGTATAKSHRMAFRFRPGTESTDEARAVLYEQSRDRETLSYFTLGEQAEQDAQETRFSNLVTLVLPAALLILLIVLGITYRDVVDVVVGMIGVLLSVVWMFGILGWLGIDAGLVAIVGPVLMVGLSVDFSFHIFMRYREQRDEGEPIVPPMRRSIRAVAPAFGLVTLTTAVGFMSNITNPLPSIRGLGIGITLGVCSALVLFVTVVPALKVAIDTLLERYGIDRHREPLGDSERLGRLFDAGLALTKRAPGVILVLALVVGVSGMLAFGALDQESYQADSNAATGWQQSLPGPLAWDVPAFETNKAYAEEQYGASTEDESTEAELLIRGPVTSGGALYRVQRLTDETRERGLVGRGGLSGRIQSPLSLVRTLAAESPSVRRAVNRADTNGDGIPNRNLGSVYDAVYAVAPDRAAQVIERRDGEYRSLRVSVRSDPTLSVDDHARKTQAAATSAESGSAPITITPVGSASVKQAVVAVVAEHIFRTLLIALGALAVVVTAVHRLINDSVTLGLLTTLPVVLVAALVFLGMYLLSIPVTLVTSLLLSLVLGLGIDYSIHVSDRFLQELEAGADRFDAIYATLHGTGGALFGTTLTSVGAFAALLLVPVPAFQSLGLMIGLAMSASFLSNIVVLPTLLSLWSRHVYEAGWRSGSRSSKTGSRPAGTRSRSSSNRSLSSRTGVGSSGAASSTSADGVPSPRSTTVARPVQSTQLTVEDLDPAIEFYVGHLGIDLRHREPTVATLLGPNRDHQVTLWRVDRPETRREPEQRSQKPQARFEVDTQAELKLLSNRLTAANVPVRTDDRDPSKQLFIDDPDGNTIVVFLDDPRVQHHKQCTAQQEPPSQEGDQASSTSATDQSLLPQAAHSQSERTNQMDDPVDRGEPTELAELVTPEELCRIVDQPRPMTRRQIVEVLAYEAGLSETEANKALELACSEGVLEEHPTFDGQFVVADGPTVSA
jgi:predicted RND superfamily exporter protein/catechol 2,3-dioxygenase-like lactoylglutathione lyase family enzyme